MPCVFDVTAKRDLEPSAVLEARQFSQGPSAVVMSAAVDGVTSATRSTGAGPPAPFAAVARGWRGVGLLVGDLGQCSSDNVGTGPGNRDQLGECLLDNALSDGHPHAVSYEIRAVVFDFDSVILETEESDFIAWREVWAEHSVELTLEEWTPCIGTVGASFDPVAELMARTAGAIDPDAVRAAQRERHLSLIARENVARGVIGFLDECDRRSLPKAIASSSDHDWVSGHLRRLGLLGRFDHFACHDGTCPPKPAPDLYLRATRALGVDPHEALAIEDSPHGITAAIAAGLWCVAVPGALTRHLDLDAAHLRFESLEHATFEAVLERVSAGRMPPTSVAR